MAHQRGDIREAVVTALTDLELTPTPQVLTEPRLFKPESLPLVAVFMPDESATLREAGAPHNYDRTARLEVVYLTTAADDAALAEALDAGAEAIEAALASDITLGGLVEDVRLAEDGPATERELVEGGGHLVGGIRISFDVQYIG